jgi:hypothetical protein
MSKPLELKSPDNAQSLGFYLLAVVLGASFAAGASQSAGLTILLGDMVAPWGLVMMLSGLTGFVSAVSCRRSYRPQKWLNVERHAAGVLGAVWVSYTVGTQLVPNATKVGLFLFGILAVASLWRACEVSWELRTLRQAMIMPATVTVESLADPHDKA